MSYAKIFPATTIIFPVVCHVGNPLNVDVTSAQRSVILEIVKLKENRVNSNVYLELSVDMRVQLRVTEAIVQKLFADN